MNNVDIKESIMKLVRDERVTRVVDIYNIISATRTELLTSEEFHAAMWDLEIDGSLVIELRLK